MSKLSRRQVVAAALAAPVVLALPAFASQPKFGSGTLRLDGNIDSIRFADHADWSLPGDFTIEAWIRFPGNGQRPTVEHLPTLLRM